jgi:hypothetical protein
MNINECEYNYRLSKDKIKGVFGLGKGGKGQLQLTTLFSKLLICL